MTKYSGLVGLFRSKTIHEVRVSVSGQRSYWASLEGSCTTTEHLVPELVQYKEEVGRDLAVRKQTSRGITKAREESVALAKQPFNVAAPGESVYSFPPPSEKASQQRRRILDLNTVGYNGFLDAQAGAAGRASHRHGAGADPRWILPGSPIPPG